MDEDIIESPMMIDDGKNLYISFIIDIFKFKCFSF